MTNNNHQPLETGAAGSSFNLNVPLQQIDAAIVNFVEGKNAFNAVALTTLAVDTTTIDMSGISAIYTRLVLVMSLRNDDAGISPINIDIQFNGDSGANYYWKSVIYTRGGGGYSSSVSGVTPGGSITIVSASVSDGQNADLRSFVMVDLPNYADTSNDKLVQFRSLATVGSSAPDMVTGGGVWASTAAINQIEVEVSGRDHQAGSSYSVWGVK